MATITHVHTQVHGVYKSSALAGEEWSFGVDLVPMLGATMDSIHTTDPAFDASFTPATGSGTGWISESNFILEGGITDIDVLDYLETTFAPAAAAYIGYGSLFPDDVYIDTIEAWPYTGEGKVAQLPVGAAYAKVTATGTAWDGGQAATTPAFAPFTSYAISKETIANVPRGRGRFYPPHPCVTSTYYDSTGLMTAVGRTAHVAGAKAFMEAAQVGTADWSLWPVVIGAPYTTAYKIVGVSIDNLPDTQRRRKASLTPVRTQATLAY